MDSQADYQRLIAPNERRMMRALWRILRNEADAEDALQNALVTIWRQWDKVAAHGNPQALILAIVVNAGYDALRRKRRFAWLKQDIAEFDTPDCAASAFDAVAGIQQFQAVMKAIARLSRNQGRAILMHAVEDMSYGDIADAMNCSEVTVRKHVARARAKLRAMLVDGGCHG